MWSSEEFGFVRLADASLRVRPCCRRRRTPTSPSSRGKACRLIGDLTGLLATLKGLPLVYNRDLQEDKEPLFDALDTCALSLAAVADRSHVRRGTHDGCGRQPRETRRRTSPSTSSNRGRPSGRRTPSWGTSCARPSSGASPSTSWSRTIRTWGRTRCALRCSNRAAQSACDARRRRTWSRRPPTGRRRPSSRGAATLARAVTLKRGFYDRDALRVRVVVEQGVGRGTGACASVEVEAYRGGDDPAAHSYRGKTTRTQPCSGVRVRCTSTSATACTGACVVCGPGATPHAVLLRAAAPLVGLDVMRDRRVKAWCVTSTSRGPGAWARHSGSTGRSSGTHRR